MKFSTFTLVIFLSSLAQASGVKDFNKVLIRDDQKEIANDNDLRLITKLTPLRAPASVDEGNENNERVEKRNVRQTGMQKW